MTFMTWLTVFLPAYLASFFFEPMNFVANLQYMGLGMICIFIVIGAIVLSVVVLDKITARLKKSGDDESAE